MKSHGTQSSRASRGPLHRHIAALHGRGDLHRGGTAHSGLQAQGTEGRTIRWAGFYDLSVRIMTLGRDGAIRKRTVDFAGIKAGDSVLDVGCGTGDLTILARRRAGPSGRVCGIDAAPEMIQVARGKAGKRGMEIDYQVGLIEEIPFSDGSFDLVLNSLMMHHLPEHLKQRGLVEMRRVLRPGGRLVIVDLKRPANLMSLAHPAMLVHRGMRRGVQDIAAMMREAGFTNLHEASSTFGVLGFTRGETA